MKKFNPTIEAHKVVKQLTKYTHLKVVKLKAAVIELDNVFTNETMWAVETKGLSQRNKVGETTYTEFPFTEEGREQAEKIAYELNHWFDK